MPKVLAAALVVTGLAGGSATARTTAPADLASLQALAGVAGQVCVAPEMFGMTRRAGGALGGQIEVSKLLRALTDAGVSASVRGGVSDWRGILQKDAAPALTARNACAERVFAKMFDAFYLTNIKSGRPVKRPPRPSAAYRSAAAHSPVQVPVIVQNSPGSIIAPSGGQNTIINEAPKPQCNLLRAAETAKEDGTYQTHFWFEVMSPYAPNYLVLTVEGDGLITGATGPANLLAGDRVEGGSYWIKIFQPHGRYDTVITTQAKVPLKATCTFG